jgi:arsenate reductase
VTYRPRVLFACEADAGASRMCAAYLEHMAGDRYEPLAAALEPSAGLGREAAAALSEDGLPAVDGPGLKMTPDLADIVDRIITPARSGASPTPPAGRCRRCG